MDQDTNKLPSSKEQTRHLRKGRVAILLAVIIFLVAGVTYALLGGSSSSANMLLKYKALL